jgi:2-polyprenyl-3-methyl-5-hydroxy-6-metoxy-1,4-benzoquinol methylase
VLHDFAARPQATPRQHPRGSRRNTRVSTVPYVLGHSESEIYRLMRQAAVLTPITTRLLRDAGLSRDMRVLDIGCGAGDVAMLAADMVGPGGAVVGIDRNKDVLSVARERARAAGHDNIDFREGAVEDFQDAARFDFAIGRYVLVHQNDPVAFIRAVASHVRPGGAVAFHEVMVHEHPTTAGPAYPLSSKVFGWIMTAFQSNLPHLDAGARMTEHFHNAGLTRTPIVSCEIPITNGPHAPHYGWIVHTLRSLMPQLEKIGAATAAEIDIDTLEERLRRSFVETHSQMFGPLQLCGWVRV